ncbi:hypothetical protein N9Y48_00635 [Zobellia sp.]|nr:hypothetical protein [Zobellia sp.]
MELILRSINISFFSLILVIGISCTSDEPSLILDRDLTDDQIEDGNMSPAVFDLLSIADDTKNVDLTQITFSWEALVGSLTYNVYFGTDPDNVDILVETTTNLSFNFSDRFNVCTTYYWKVVANDGNGGVTESSSTYSFSTRNVNVHTNALTYSANFEERSRHTSVVFQDKLWVIGGMGDHVDKQYSNVWYSADGIEWEEISSNSPFGFRLEHNSVVFKDKIWVIGGGRISTNNTWQSLTDIWSSPDGWNWTEVSAQIPFSTIYHYSTIVFQDKLWVFGGYNNIPNMPNEPNHKIWSSSDGVVWQEHDSPPNSSLDGKGSALLFKDAIWFLDHRGVVQKSTDGINWSLVVNESSSYGEAIWHDSVVFDNHIWIIGGQVFPNGAVQGEYTNNIWKSSDGITWEQVEAPDEFPVRSLHTALSMNDKIFIIAGNSPYQSNDVWVID